MNLKCRLASEGRRSGFCVRVGKKSIAAQEERRLTWQTARSGGVVACARVSAIGQGGPVVYRNCNQHDVIPCLPARVINTDVGSTRQVSVLPAQIGSCERPVEMLVQQARALLFGEKYEHLLLELCCS